MSENPDALPSLLDDADADATDQGTHATRRPPGRNSSIPASAAPAYAALIIIGKELRGKSFALSGPEVMIGRSAAATIRVREWGVSRRHALIRRVGDAFEIEDLQSSNGTFVNTRRITGPTRLGPGDKVRVGRTLFIVTYSDEPLEDQSYISRWAEESVTDSSQELVVASLGLTADASTEWRVPCAIYRAGTSRAMFFLVEYLPNDPEKRDRMVLAAFGSPDPRQIDGLGGADPLTSKAGYIGHSSVPGADVDYTFGYVAITQAIIDYTGSCGNTAAAVGPFALLRGLVEATDPLTTVRIHDTNTGKIIVAEFPTHHGKFVSRGGFRIDGVPGTGSKIRLDFVGSGGSVTGRLLPTGNPVDTIHFPGVGTLTVSLVDAANPFIFVRGTDLGLRGDETIEEISMNRQLLKDCEIIRSVAAEIMGIARSSDATEKSPGVPKIALVTEPMTYLSTKRGREGDPEARTIEASQVDIVARMTALQKLHKTFAVTGAVCLGTAAKIDGTIVQDIFRRAQPTDPTRVRIGHPSGTIEVEVEVTRGADGQMELQKATLLRTARLLMEGDLHIPER